MQSAKHLAALGLLGVFGILMAAGAKKPADKFVSTVVPPVDRREAAMATAQVVATADACMRARGADPKTTDALSYQALQDACFRAAEDQMRGLEWRQDDWDIVHPGTDSVEPARRKPVGSPRVARRNASGNDESTANRSR